MNDDIDRKNLPDGTLSYCPQQGGYWTCTTFGNTNLLCDWDGSGCVGGN